MKTAHRNAARTACSTLLASLVLSFLALFALVPTAGAASGDLAWQRIINGPGNGDDAFYGLAPAPNGGVYAAGHVFDATYDVLAVRYDAAGQRHWSRTYDGSLQAGDFAYAEASDRNGNLVVVGDTNYPSSSVIMVTAKYGPGGQRKWVRTYDDPAGASDRATNVAVDAAGNVYVAGYTLTGTGYGIVLIKYSPSGTRRWVRRYVGPADHQANDIGLDAAGNVYLTGRTWTGSQFDILTLKYDPAGHRRWLRTWDDPAGGNDYGFGMAVTGAGTVFVAGQGDSASSGADAVLLKYVTSSALKWVRSQTSAGAAVDQFHDVVRLSNGDVAAAGYVTSSVTQQDVLIARLSSTGNVRWVRTYDGPDSLGDYSLNVAGGTNGAIYVAGYSYGATTSGDILTLKYSGAGDFRWARRHSSAGASTDIGWALLVTRASVYVAGYEGPNGAHDATLLKYKP